MKYMASVSRLVPHFRELEFEHESKYFFDMMSGSLVWEDEKISGLPDGELGCLRALFRFRTSLILEKPDERFQCLWDELVKVYPEWIGMKLERVSPDSEVKSFLEKQIDG